LSGKYHHHHIEIEGQAHIMSEYEHQTSLNFTVQFVSKKSVKMKAAFSAQKSWNLSIKMHGICLCVCAEELHIKRMAQSIMKPLTHLELLTLHGLLPCIMVTVVSVLHL
jgi:hypothetical protein